LYAGFLTLAFTLSFVYHSLGEAPLMDQLLTKTLTEIYLEQGHFEKAYSIFKALSDKNPADSELQSRLR
jgi:predicted Zn-dependent protease